jgi:hypothetical protein
MRKPPNYEKSIIISTYCLRVLLSLPSAQPTGSSIADTIPIVLSGFCLSDDSQVIDEIQWYHGISNTDFEIIW